MRNGETDFPVSPRPSLTLRSEQSTIFWGRCIKLTVCGLRVRKKITGPQLLLCIKISFCGWPNRKPQTAKHAPIQIFQIKISSCSAQRAHSCTNLRLISYISAGAALKAANRKPQNEAAKLLYIAIYGFRPANTPAKYYTSPPGHSWKVAKHCSRTCLPHQRCHRRHRSRLIVGNLTRIFSVSIALYLDDHLPYDVDDFTDFLVLPARSDLSYSIPLVAKFDESPTGSRHRSIRRDCRGEGQTRRTCQGCAIGTLHWSLQCPSPSSHPAASKLSPPNAR